MMKKILIIGLVLLGILLWQLVDIFVTVQADKRQGLDDQLSFIRQETGLTIMDVERYHGEKLYYIFTAFDPEDEEYSYLLLANDQDKAQIRFEDIALSKEGAAEVVQQHFSELEEISRIVPAYVDDQFVWEIAGYDQENSLQYIYYTMESGTFVKRYRVDPFKE